MLRGTRRLAAPHLCLRSKQGSSPYSFPAGRMQLLAIPQKSQKTKSNMLLSRQLLAVK